MSVPAAKLGCIRGLHLNIRRPKQEFLNSPWRVCRRTSVPHWPRVDSAPWRSRKRRFKNVWTPIAHGDRTSISKTFGTHPMRGVADRDEVKATAEAYKALLLRSASPNIWVTTLKRETKDATPSSNHGMNKHWPPKVTTILISTERSSIGLDLL